MKASPVCYFEIPAPNIKKAASFYRLIFGWSLEPSDLSDFDYWMFTTGEKSLMGALDASKAVQSGGVIVYIKVDDIPSSLEQIGKSGGEVLREKFDIGGNYGYSAIFKDPSGNHMGLWSKD